MRRFIQVVMAGSIAAPLVNLVTWQIVFRLWPMCQSSDGSNLLCALTSEYTRPRDLTSAAISVALAGCMAAVLNLWIERMVRRRERATWSNGRQHRNPRRTMHVRKRVS